MLNQHIFKVIVSSSEIIKEFTVIAINFQLDILIKAAHGGVGLRHVKRAEVENLPIPLPSLAEQKRIVAELEVKMAVADRAEGLARQQLAEIRAMPATLLWQAFNGA